MKIDDDHLYHGAAIIQIAEHTRFTAINSIPLSNGVSRSAYLVNETVGVYLKYASKPKGLLKEFTFTFLKDHLDELDEIADTIPGVYVVLICVGVREICVLSHDELRQLIEFRRANVGYDEDQYIVLVTAQPRKSFRVYVNASGVRRQFAGQQLTISRNAFPDSIFPCP